MKCISTILIFNLFFNVAFGQSRISGPPTNSVTNAPITNYNLQQQTFLPENGYPQTFPQMAKRESAPQFTPGVLITNNGDTLRGLVKYDYLFSNDKVSYKQNPTAPDSVFPIRKIKSIITQFVYLANIPFEGKEIMMPWLSVGKINLYSYSKYYDDITYVLEKNNQYSYINRKDFKSMMRHVFFDVPDLLKKIGTKGYRFDGMIGIVKEYNKRFQQTNK